MKPLLAAWLLRRWYGGVAPGPILRLLSSIYAVLLRVREALFRRGWRRSHRFDVPVVVVGNLVAGGSGKTPLTIAIAKDLVARGWRPGVVSRGYGRRERAPVRVGAGTSAATAGDEPLLIARRAGVPVQVDADRVAAARALVADGCTLILADDGLQHRRLARDVEIEVLDGVRRHGNGRLLPAGPLREPADRRVDLRVVNGGVAAEGEWSMTLELAEAVPLGGGAARALSAFAPGPVHAVAGIGHPERFFAALRALGIDLVAHPFPDHHHFTAADFAFAPPLPILMTEKDAMKCGRLGLRDAWAVPANAMLPAGFFDALNGRLAERKPVHAHS